MGSRSQLGEGEGDEAGGDSGTPESEAVLCRRKSLSAPHAKQMFVFT